MSRGKGILAVVLIVILLVTVFGLFALTRAKRHAESLNCASSICSMCLAARLWAEDNAFQFPTNFVCMSNELNTTKILVCAADHTRRPAKNWERFTTENSSYEMLSTGLPATNPNISILRCKVHGHIGYADGTVFDGVRRRGKYD